MNQIELPIFEESNCQIIQGDCLEVMRTFPDNHFSAIVTDPPYGLSFMNKGWDHETPQTECWRQCYRVIKPGGYILVMGGTRTFHKVATSIEAGGFEIRDTLMWVYGSGFPKSHNHFGLRGYGTALKPAYEPVVMAMKPCDGTFKQNAEKWGQAGINIDGCRIQTEDKLGGGGLTGCSSKKEGWDRPWKHDEKAKQLAAERCKVQVQKSESLGRWPANIILDEEAGKMLDEQSGNLKSGHLKQILNHKQNKIYGKFQRAKCNEFESNSGGASRFFYCAKASSSERNEGLEEFPLKECQSKQVNSESRYEKGIATNIRPNEPKRQNHHPTVKPLKLMEYLIKLVMPPENGLLLDPFAGSGTTILAAKNLGFDAIGIEREQEYCDIARARLL